MKKGLTNGKLCCKMVKSGKKWYKVVNNVDATGNSIFG
jgi:hypothetical protein